MGTFRLIKEIANILYGICSLERSMNPLATKGLSDMESASWFENTHRIIGNIYENPELMIYKKGGDNE